MWGSLPTVLLGAGWAILQEDGSLWGFGVFYEAPWSDLLFYPSCLGLSFILLSPAPWLCSLRLWNLFANFIFDNRVLNICNLQVSYFSSHWLSSQLPLKISIVMILKFLLFVGASLFFGGGAFVDGGHLNHVMSFSHLFILVWGICYFPVAGGYSDHQHFLAGTVGGRCVGERGAGCGFAFT